MKWSVGVIVLTCAAFAGAAQIQEDADRYAAASALRKLSAFERADLFRVREGVWRAWFKGDEAALRKVLPPETIVSGDGAGWMSRDATISASIAFVKAGGRLLKLDFPTTEVQAYGATAILYTTYTYEIESGGKRINDKGSALEVFVRRPEGWIHTGWQLRSDPGTAGS